METQTTRRRLLKSGALVGATGAYSLTGCIGSITGGGGSKIKVSSKRFAESKILGYMAIEAINENTDLQAVDKTGLGGSTQNFQAVKKGEVDLFWEYTGTIWTTYPPKHEKIVRDPKKLWRKVKRNMKKEHNLEYLDFAEINNTYAMLVRPNWKKETGVTNLEEFGKWIGNGNVSEFSLVLPKEFHRRPDGWPGLAKHYNFENSDKKLENKNKVREVGIGLVYQIVSKKKATMGVGFATDGKILTNSLDILEDNQSFFPVYNPAPLVNGDAYNDQLKEPLNKISKSLKSNKDMQRLNKKVSVDRENAQEVAKSYLKDIGVI